MAPRVRSSPGTAPSSPGEHRAPLQPQPAARGALEALTSARGGPPSIGRASDGGVVLHREGLSGLASQRCQLTGRAPRCGAGRPTATLPAVGAPPPSASLTRRDHPRFGRDVPRGAGLRIRARPRAAKSAVAAAPARRGAREAGVGSTTLHRHFPSRAALLEAVFPTPRQGPVRPR